MLPFFDISPMDGLWMVRIGQPSGIDNNDDMNNIWMHVHALLFSSSGLAIGLAAHCLRLAVIQGDAILQTGPPRHVPFLHLALGRALTMRLCFFTAGTDFALALDISGDFCIIVIFQLSLLSTTSGACA